MSEGKHLRGTLGTAADAVPGMAAGGDVLRSTFPADCNYLSEWVLSVSEEYGQYTFFG